MRRIIYYGILIFIFSCFVGFFYGRLWKNNNQELASEDEKVDNSVKETYSSEEKISFDCSFAIKKHYDECGHTQIFYSELPSEMINLNENELKSLYSDYNVEEFSSKEVILSKEEGSICNEHYVLKLYDDIVDIFHLEKDGEEALYKTTSISKEYLTPEDINSLKDGIYVYGKENINSIIEDYE